MTKAANNAFAMIDTTPVKFFTLDLVLFSVKDTSLQFLSNNAAPLENSSFPTSTKLLDFLYN